MPKRTDLKKILVIGSGPIRIGQGVEFDYSTVHAIQTIRHAGYEAIIINNNPEKVSTDYTTSDKLYFEPLTVEDVMNIVELERPIGVIASLGGQTAINLAQPLADRGVTIIGTDCEAILSGIHYEDGVAIRRCAIENGVTMLTALDTVKVLLDVLEEMTMGISTIDAQQ